MEENKKKYYFIIGIVTILLFIVGASYAYFTVSTTNNFGTHTISGTMESVGSVALTGTSNNISLNLSAADMMQGNNDIYYYGSTDGTPSTSFNTIKLADAVVTGSGVYNCNYTMSITATGTNNMYTAFQNMTGKSNGQIVLSIGDYDYFVGGENGEMYDFYTTNLFPITYSGTLTGISSTNPGSIYGLFGVNNSSSIDQTALAGTDIQMTATVTSFTCTVVRPTYAYWNTNYNSNRYDNNETLVTNNYPYYIKTLVSGNTDISNEVCGVFGSTEVCLKPNDWSNASTYKSQMEAAGATCNSTYAQDNYLGCSASVGSLFCRMYSVGYVNCNVGDPYCDVNSNGSANCDAGR